MNILFVLNEVWCLYIVENKTRVNLKTGVTRKESAPNFPISGCKKCLFLGKFKALCFLATLILRSALFALLSTICIFSTAVLKTTYRAFTNLSIYQ